MKAKDLMSLLIFLGITAGCKGKAKEEYDFIAFKDKKMGWDQIFPTGTDYRIIGIGYDFGCNGTIDSIYMQVTGEGLNRDKPGAKTVIDKYNTKYMQAEQSGRVKHVE